MSNVTVHGHSSWLQLCGACRTPHSLCGQHAMHAWRREELCLLHSSCIGWQPPMHPPMQPPKIQPCWLVCMHAHRSAVWMCSQLAARDCSQLWRRMWLHIGEVVWMCTDSSDVVAHVQSGHPCPPARFKALVSSYAPRLTRLELLACVAGSPGCVACLPTLTNLTHLALDLDPSECERCERGASKQTVCGGGDGTVNGGDNSGSNDGVPVMTLSDIGRVGHSPLCAHVGGGVRGCGV